MTDQTPASLFTRLAVVKAITDAAKAVEQDTKAALQDVMDPGDRKSATHDGRDVGTVSYAKASATAKVTDRAAFTAWATTAYPTEVRMTLDHVDADMLMDALIHVAGDTRRDDLADRRAASYEAIMRIVETTPARVSEAWEKGLLDKLAKLGEPVDPATGEVVPGVTCTPGGAGTYVSIRQSEAQRQALLDLYAGGSLDLVELATTSPLAVES